VRRFEISICYRDGALAQMIFRRCDGSCSPRVDFSVSGISHFHPYFCFDFVRAGSLPIHDRLRDRCLDGSNLLTDFISLERKATLCRRNLFRFAVFDHKHL
jgi:hypothetical protein